MSIEVLGIVKYLGVTASLYFFLLFTFLFMLRIIMVPVSFIYRYAMICGSVITFQAFIKTFS